MADEKPVAVITFTSDFGGLDGYTGIVKGVMLSISGAAQIVDLSHQIDPFNTSSAAWIIYNAYNHFPKGSVHLVVVDPGVGSSRRGVLLKLDDHFFVGPDNGVFSLLVADPLNKRRERGALQAFELDAKSRFYASDGISSTFHARDIYGRVAAHLTLGVEPSRFGTHIELSSLSPNEACEIERNESGIRGKVAHIDHFGNLITNIPIQLLNDNAICFVSNQLIGPLRTTYQSVEKGELAAIRGSHGFLEVASCEGRADSKIAARVGDMVEVKLRSG